MTAFLANENISLKTVEELRAHGHDVKWISETLPSVKDQLILMQATAENRIIITFDSDYGELIFKYNMPPPLGVVYLRLHSTDSSEAANLILKHLAVSPNIFDHRFSVLKVEGLRFKPL